MEDNKHHQNHNAIKDQSCYDDDITSAVNEVAKEEQYLLDTEQISNDISNASKMLSYILDGGLDIDKNHIDVVVDSKDKFKRKNWSKDTEIKFYLTYKELTKLIKPVTVDSLAASRPSGNEKVGPVRRFFGWYSQSQWSTARFMVATMIFMFALLGVHIYFFLGSTRLDNISECMDESDKLLSRMKDLSILTQKDPENLSFSSEYEECNMKLNEYDNKLQSNVDLLGPWVQKLRSITFNTTIETDTIAKTDINYNRANTAIIQEAKSYRLILGTYVLPLLYGIIGSLTFVIRELTSEIKKLTFSSGSNTKYILRTLLGAISGLAIGLFWGDIQNAQQLGALSPMFLAFIAGYCVEYLLQFVEKSTENFFHKNDGSQQRTEPEKDNHNKCCEPQPHHGR